MRHRGTKPGRPKAPRGYAWYDRETGRIDLCLLASDATREEDPPVFAEPPRWIVDLPGELPDASPVELARIDAEARRKYLHSGDY